MGGCAPGGVLSPQSLAQRRVTSLALPQLPSCLWSAVCPRPVERLLWDIQQETGA